MPHFAQPEMKAAVFPLQRAGGFSALTVLFLFGLWTGTPGASAQSGPFAEFPGSWSGAGTIRFSDGAKERLRCRAVYRVRGTTGRDIDLQLTCASDNYKFDLAGEFRVDESDQISGRWTERSRGIGGSAIGRVRGERIQVHVESSGFAADVAMTTRSGRQSVSIDSQGGGQTVESSIMLRRDQR
jgi:hypothetical protein